MGDDWQAVDRVPRETFFYPGTSQLLTLLDEAARRSAVSRGHAFEDFLHMTVCALSGGAMEEQYLAVVQKHSNGERGQRGCDTMAMLLGTLVDQMEDTRDEIRDVLGDLFQGAVTYNEAGQFLTPEPLCRLMAGLTVDDLSAEEVSEKKSVCDPCCGSGRMLLAVAETHRHWEFVGQDIDLRCVRMTAINLALRNLYGYVIHGNSLSAEQKLVYRTGFNLRGVLREISLAECPLPVQQAATGRPVVPEPIPCSGMPVESIDATPELKQQLYLF